MWGYQLPSHRERPAADVAATCCCHLPPAKAQPQANCACGCVFAGGAADTGTDSNAVRCGCALGSGAAAGKRRNYRYIAFVSLSAAAPSVKPKAVFCLQNAFRAKYVFGPKVRNTLQKLFAQRSFPLFAQGSFPFSRQGSFHISFFRCAHFATATPALFNSQKQQGSSSLLTNSQQARRGASRVATMTSFFVFRGVQKPQGHQGGHHFRPPWCVCGFCSNEKVFILLLQRTTQTREGIISVVPGVSVVSVVMKNCFFVTTENHKDTREDSISVFPDVSVVSV